MKWHRVKSSTLHSVAHDAATLELRVAFRAPRGRPERGGATYLYRGVPRVVYTTLIETNRKRGSVGRMFHELVRKKFTGEKIEGGPPRNKKIKADAYPRCGGVVKNNACRSCDWRGETMAVRADGAARHPVELIEDKIMLGDAPGAAEAEPDLYELMEKTLRGTE